MNYFVYYSPMGSLIGKIYVRYFIENDKIAVSGLWFENQKHFDIKLLECDVLLSNDDIKSCLDDYFLGKKTEWEFDIYLDVSEFSKKVLDELMKIPYGEVRTYKFIADSIGCKSCQAVAGAISHNPISIIIPCHRIIGKDGSLTGYAGGLDRKKYLLELERRSK